MSLRNINVMSTRILLSGCSGIGKTTVAKAISELYDIPFISGSYSDLVPETKDIPHSEMINQEARSIFENDVKLLNLRKKAFNEHEVMVSDRSYLDSAAYMINKLSHRIPECEVEDFIEKCRTLLVVQCDALIYIPFHKNYLSKWQIEDNGKRVLSHFYQSEITVIMNWLLLDYWGLEWKSFYRSRTTMNPGSSVGIFTGFFSGNKLTIPVLTLNEINHDLRMATIKQFLAEYVNLKPKAIEK